MVGVGSHKALTKGSARSMSKMTRATAASVNMTKSGYGTQSQLNPALRTQGGASNLSKGSIGRRTAASAVGKLTKPHS